MIQLFKEFAQEAREYAEEKYPGSFVKYDPQWFAFYNEKLAELIVKECALQCDDMDECERITKLFGFEWPDIEFFVDGVVTDLNKLG